MAHYGEILDSSYHPNRDNLYSLFIQYFGDLAMTKIKDVQNYSMYVAKIHCLLSTENRYVIVFVPSDNLPLGNTEQLRNLRWETLQTRALSDNHGIAPQTYKPRRMKEFMVPIIMTEKTDKQYNYSCEKYPTLQITMLPRKKGELEYQPKGSIVSAIETYSTVFSFSV